MPDTLHRSTYRVLKIFDFLSDHPEGMSLTQLSLALDVPKGSLHPILKTMLAMNYIRISQDGLYQIGQAAYFTGSSYTKNNDLLQEIDFIIKRTSQEVEQTLFLAVLSEGNVLYIIQERFATPLEIHLRPGYKFPAYTTGIGKALLCHHTEEQLHTLYPEGLQKLTDYTITDFSVLTRQLSEIRETGFSFDKEESTEGLQCIAVPITYHDHIIAAVSCVSSVYYYNDLYEAKVKSALGKSRKEIEKVISLNPQDWIYSPLS